MITLKQYLNFELNGQFISRKYNLTPVAKSRNYFYAHFDFLTPEWSGIKTALFTRGNDRRSVMVDENGDCLIPWEFFDTDSETIGRVSVYCGDLMTANEAYVRILRSGYGDSDASEPPTPNIYEQLLEQLDKINSVTMISGGTFSDWKEGEENGN